MREWIALAALTLAACGGADSDAPGSVSPQEARELNEAAAALDVNAATADANSSEDDTQ